MVIFDRYVKLPEGSWENSIQMGDLRLPRLIAGGSVDIFRRFCWGYFVVIFPGVHSGKLT